MNNDQAKAEWTDSSCSEGEVCCHVLRRGGTNPNTCTLFFTATFIEPKGLRVYYKQSRALIITDNTAC